MDKPIEQSNNEQDQAISTKQKFEGKVIKTLAARRLSGYWFRITCIFTYFPSGRPS